MTTRAAVLFRSREVISDSSAAALLQRARSTITSIESRDREGVVTLLKAFDAQHQGRGSSVRISQTETAPAQGSSTPIEGARPWTL